MLRPLHVARGPRRVSKSWMLLPWPADASQPLPPRTSRPLTLLLPSSLLTLPLPSAHFLIHHTFFLVHMNEFEYLCSYRVLCKVFRCSAVDPSAVVSRACRFAALILTLTAPQCRNTPSMLLNRRCVLRLSMNCVRLCQYRQIEVNVVVVERSSPYFSTVTFSRAAWR